MYAFAYTYMYVTTINKKNRGHEFEREPGGVYGKFGGKKGKG